MRKIFERDEFLPLPLRERAGVWGRILFSAVLIAAGSVAAFGQNNSGQNATDIAGADKKLFKLNLSSGAAEDLKTLRVLDPSPSERIYHGKWTKDVSGRYVSSPDRSMVATLKNEENLNPTDAEVFARFFATRDEIAHIEDSAAQAETSYHAVLAMPEGPRKEKILNAKRVAQAKFTQENERRLENLSGKAIADYRVLLKDLGESKVRAIFGRIQQKSEARRASHLKLGEEARSAETAKCREGLAQCKFPEGLISNCAAYLGMTVEEIQSRCPHPGKLEDK